MDYVLIAMLKNLLVDGAKFKLWTPKPEKTAFHPIVKEHAREIFGQNARFLSISPRLRSEADLRAEPDGLVVDPVSSKLFVVEVELSEHNPYGHINDQLTRFISGMKSIATQNKVAEALFDTIESDKELQGYFEEKVTGNVYRWLQRLVGRKPTIVVVIEKKTPEVMQACDILMESYDTRIIEFQTFRREDNPAIHAYLYETLAEVSEGSSIPVPEPSKASLERGQRYLSFYQELGNRLQEKVPSAIAKPKSLYYCKIPTKIAGIHFEWAFGGTPRATFGVELHFERSSKEANIALLKKFEKYNDDIEKATGERVIFEENWTSRLARLYLEKKEGQMTEELKTWAVDKMAALYNLLQPKLEVLQ